MMNIEDILEEIAETLRGFEWMKDIPVIVEEKGDPDNKSEMDIAQQSMCVVVGENGYSPTVQEPDDADPNCVIGNWKIVVSIFEKPVINRADKDAITLKALSHKIGKVIAWSQAKGMATPLWLVNMTPVSLFRVEGDEDAIITRDVEFTTTAEL